MLSTIGDSSIPLTVELFKEHFFETVELASEQAGRILVIFTYTLVSIEILVSVKFYEFLIRLRCKQLGV